MDKQKFKMLFKKNEKFFDLLSYIYVLFFDHNRLEKKKCYGNKNKDKRILIIRPNTEDGIQGLMSLFIQTMRWIDFAKRTNLIPVVDFKNYKTQYSDGSNIWDYFFTQPSKMTLEEAYNSKYVIISGKTFRPQVNAKLFRETVFSDSTLCKYCYDLIWNNIKISEVVEDIVDNEDLHINVNNCIGVYLRGTDYVKLRPSGEFMQPSIKDVEQVLNEFIDKYPLADIFLVTEDYSYFYEFTEKYDTKLKVVSFDSFVKGYDGKDYLSKSGLLNSNHRKRGLDYFVKIVLLSRCRYLISSITMGSIAAYCINGGKYSDDFIFNLGLYP